jgi:hypothetical protein
MAGIDTLANDLFAAKRPLACVQQLERAQRAFARFEALRTSRRGTKSAEYVEIEDALWSFFQNCWYVKDWAKNDPALPSVVRQAVVDAAHTNPVLKTVQSLANGSKHLDLETETHKPKAKDGGIIFDEPGDGTIRLDFAISHDDGRVDRAAELATRALDAWRQILTDAGIGTRGLIPPSSAI